MAMCRTWPLLCLHLIGLLASVGYVGCFSIVQNSVSTSGPVSWLCLEAGLSLVRLAIWAWNSMRDDTPPLEINLELDKSEPFPTCNKDNEKILRSKVLPLTRAPDFLKSITSFIGLIKLFSIPDTSLHYTLTRKRPSKKSVLRRNRDNKPENAKNHKLGERTIYHGFRSQGAYVGHFILEVKIDTKIDSNVDPVCSDNNNLDRRCKLTM